MSVVRVNLPFMSIYGGMMILVVLFLRLLLHSRLPKRIFSILWCVVLLRLLAPFSVDAPFSVFSVLREQMTILTDPGPAGGEDRLAELFPEGLYPRAAFGSADGRSAAGIGASSGGGNASEISGAFGGRNVSGINGVSDGGNTAVINGSRSGENAADIGGTFGGGSPAADHRRAKKSFSCGSGKWSLLRKIGMAGTMLFASVFLALYLNCLRRFRTALPVEDPEVEQWLGRNRLLRRVRVCRSDRISSPLTYGFIRPVILLSEFPGQEGQKLKYILQHEMVHIRRFDGIWKLAMTAALCLHWFHPLVWVMYVFMNRDLELSCDEAVLRVFGAEARKGYALTLIGMEESRQLPVILYSSFGKSAVEERVGEIMRYKKKTKIAAGTGAVLVLAVVCMFATTSKAGENTGEADKDPVGADISAYLPMDPPAGYSGESGSRDGAAGSGEEEGTEVPFENMGENTAGGENAYRLTYIKEGMPESEPAQLVTGQGYDILLPREGWTAFGPDGWMSEQNNKVELWVAHFSAEGSDYEGFDREQIVEALLGQGYQESDNDCYWMLVEAEDRMSMVELRSDDEGDIWGVFYTYPGEAEDGWGVELRTIAQTFSINRSGLGEGASAGGETEEKMAEAAMAKWLLQRLRDASAEEDHDSIKQHLAEGYEVDTDILEEIREWKEGEIHVRFHPTGDHCVASIQVITTESEEDSYDYLTVELLKEGEDWKICFMGLEK